MILSCNIVFIIERIIKLAYNFKHIMFCPYKSCFEKEYLKPEKDSCMYKYVD